MLVHKSGLITVRETPVLDIRIGEISYVKVEGTLRKVLVIGVRGAGGQVQAYKIHVATPESWYGQIYNLKGGSSSSGQLQAKTAKYCTQCGQELGDDAKFCPSCGKPVK